MGKCEFTFLGLSHLRVSPSVPGVTPRTNRLCSMGKAPVHRYLIGGAGSFDLPISMTKE